MAVLPKDFLDVKRGMKFTCDKTLWVICGFMSEPPRVRAYNAITGDGGRDFPLDDDLVYSVKEFQAIWGNTIKGESGL